DYRGVSPALVEPLFAGDNDTKTLIAAEVEIGGVGGEIIDGVVIVGTDELKLCRSLDAEGAADNTFALNDALGWRFIVLDDRSCVGCGGGWLCGDWRRFGGWRRCGGRRGCSG